MAKLQYKEFKHKVENGSITDLKPYISYSGAFRVLIASKGNTSTNYWPTKNRM